MIDFITGKENKQATADLSKNPLFTPTFEDEYRLARKIGEQRFGSECKHEKTVGNKCLNCLRTVVAKIGGLK